MPQLGIVLPPLGNTILPPYSYIYLYFIFQWLFCSNKFYLCPLNDKKNKNYHTKFVACWSIYFAVFSKIAATAVSLTLNVALWEAYNVCVIPFECTRVTQSLINRWRRRYNSKTFPRAKVRYNGRTWPRQGRRERQLDARGRKRHFGYYSRCRRYFIAVVCPRTLW